MHTNITDRKALSVKISPVNSKTHAQFQDDGVKCKTLFTRTYVIYAIQCRTKHSNSTSFASFGLSVQSDSSIRLTVFVRLCVHRIVQLVGLDCTRIHVACSSSQVRTRNLVVCIKWSCTDVFGFWVASTSCF